MHPVPITVPVMSLVLELLAPAFGHHHAAAAPAPEASTSRGLLEPLMGPGDRADTGGYRIGLAVLPCTDRGSGKAAGTDHCIGTSSAG